MPNTAISGRSPESDPGVAASVPTVWQAMQRLGYTWIRNARECGHTLRAAAGTMWYHPDGGGHDRRNHPHRHVPARHCPAPENLRQDRSRQARCLREFGDSDTPSLTDVPQKLIELANRVVAAFGGVGLRRRDSSSRRGKNAGVSSGTSGARRREDSFEPSLANRPALHRHRQCDAVGDRALPVYRPACPTHSHWFNVFA
jgi:hypothetical protein